MLSSPSKRIKEQKMRKHSGRGQVQRKSNVSFMTEMLEQRTLLSVAYGPNIGHQLKFNPDKVTAPPKSRLVGLDIVPTFDATITGDPNAATIMATINGAIAE